MRSEKEIRSAKNRLNTKADDLLQEVVPPLPLISSLYLRARVLSWVLGVENRVVNVEKEEE